MKKVSLYSALMLTAMMVASCGGQKNLAQNNSQSRSNNPFGESFEAPCQIYDTDEDFAATGIYRGSMEQLGEVQLNARQNALQSIREKFANTYKGTVSNYSDSYGNNKGNDITSKLQRAGDQVIEAVLNHAKDECVKYSAIGDDGRVQCYVAVRISKAEVAKKVAQAVSDALTDEEKLKIDFNEDRYRKEVEERMAKYKENR